MQALLGLQIFWLPVDGHVVSVHSPFRSVVVGFNTEMQVPL